MNSPAWFEQMEREQAEDEQYAADVREERAELAATMVPTRCPYCDGRGLVPMTMFGSLRAEPCTACAGSGRITIEVSR